MKIFLQKICYYLAKMAIICVFEPLVWNKSQEIFRINRRKNSYFICDTMFHKKNLFVDSIRVLILSTVWRLESKYESKLNSTTLQYWYRKTSNEECKEWHQQRWQPWVGAVSAISDSSDGRRFRVTNWRNKSFKSHSNSIHCRSRQLMSFSKYKILRKYWWQEFGCVWRRECERQSILGLIGWHYYHKY